MAVSKGQKAPDFTLVDTAKKPVTLSSFAGKKVVLLFYPGAFTGVCDKEMCSFRDSLAHYNNLQAQVLGISVDAPFVNKAFAEKYNIQFPLLSDYTRKVASQSCGLFKNLGGLEGYDVANRAVYVIDGSGTVTYSWVTENPGVEPNYDEVKKAVE
ncbi:MAG: peroxiredoxin [Bacteroidetes bacterium]|nr:peroxiredoxin [Bacteroidota bacterium]